VTIGVGPTVIRADAAAGHARHLPRGADIGDGRDPEIEHAVDWCEPGQVLAVGTDSDIEVVRIVKEHLARDQFGLLRMRLPGQPGQRQRCAQDRGVLQEMAAVDRRGHANLR
jgi:hypothetical protein